MEIGLLTAQVDGETIGVSGADASGTTPFRLLAASSKYLFSEAKAINVTFVGMRSTPSTPVQCSVSCSRSSGFGSVKNTGANPPPGVLKFVVWPW